MSHNEYGAASHNPVKALVSPQTKDIDRDATSIKCSFKMAGGTIEFKAITKEEYQEQTEAFKKQAEEKIDDDNQMGHFKFICFLNENCFW